MSPKKILVFGTGVSGLVAAINLARSGYHVNVVEKNQNIDGPKGWHPSIQFTSFNIEATSWLWRSATARVCIVDSTNAPVQSATVNGQWSGGANDTDRFTTGADGWGTATSNWCVGDAIFRFCVTSVSKDGWTYDAGANEITCRSTP